MRKPLTRQAFDKLIANRDAWPDEHVPMGGQWSDAEIDRYLKAAEAYDTPRTLDEEDINLNRLSAAQLAQLAHCTDTDEVRLLIHTWVRDGNGTSKKRGGS